MQASILVQKVHRFLLSSPDKKTAADLERLTFWIFCFSVVFSTACSVIMLFQAFSMPNQYDSGFLYYQAWLVNEKGLVPFRDIIETSFPGTYVAYSLITGLFGYTDFSFHLANVAILAVFLSLIWVLMRREGFIFPAVSMSLFSMYYLGNFSFALQRDYLCLFPLMIALILATRNFFGLVFTSLFAGFLFALSAAIKPHFLIGLPAVIGYIVKCDTSGLCLRSRIVRAALFSGIGIVLCLFMFWVWLVSKQAYPGFMEVVMHYLPLYMRLNGNIGEIGYVLPDFTGFIGFLLFPWPKVILGGVLVLMLAWGMGSPFFYRAVLFLSLYILYKAYVLLGNKLWDYHYIPSELFWCFVVSFLTLPVRQTQMLIVHLLRFFLVVYLVGDILLGQGLKLVLRWYFPENDISRSRSELVQFLGSRLEAGDGVHVHVKSTYNLIYPSLLSMELPTAVPRYPIAQFFYFNTADPYIKKSREYYLSSIERAAPRFILDDKGFEGFVGADGVPVFREYDDYIRKNYRLVYENNDETSSQFVIYERIPRG